MNEGSRSALGVLLQYLPYFRMGAVQRRKGKGVVVVRCFVKLDGIHDAPWWDSWAYDSSGVDAALFFRKCGV